MPTCGYPKSQQNIGLGHTSLIGQSYVLLNNMCEVYNGKILEGRDKPIISAIEYIREYLMRRIVTVLRVIEKSEGLLTPYATKMLEVNKKEATHCHVRWNGGDLYEVSDKPGQQRVVDLGQKNCACRRWELTGMPCRHAVAAIWFMARMGKGLVLWKVGFILCTQWIGGDKFILLRLTQSMATHYGPSVNFLQLLHHLSITPKWVDPRRQEKGQQQKLRKWIILEGCQRKTLKGHVESVGTKATIEGLARVKVVKHLR
ncbi:hypothetical protein E3N88_36156 [Mikania micrantha]|uniref:SWIM-type domain-containing protein n=1 Tax=Mikania micrantha TaxID=192012 RepID=A0A5N6M3Z7_9ASTR|nr:hypothetical protein E3N88_36156 [Mikania micrantha]